ncbi:MAG: pilus assembly protein N-terminal domain-containing protein [Planctomycetota bacterium]
MYHYSNSLTLPHSRSGLAFLVAIAGWLIAGPAEAQIVTSTSSVVRTISAPSEKLEITTNTSRILTLGKRIPRVQVNNPELLTVTPLSATQVQVAAKKAGVTAINLWDEEGNIHSVDVFVYGDVRELEHALKTQFPNSSVKVYRYSNALVLTGFIDRPDYVTPIVELAQDYSPKVINNISVGGVQQVLLKVKIFEVSRTKLRTFGNDFGWLGGNGGFFSSGVSGLLSNTTNAAAGAVQTITDSGGQSVEFGIVNGSNQFFGLLDALQQHNLAKILAEPNIVAVSGRPAQFNEGGEIPILIPQGLGQVSIEYKPFGTQVDFLPIVLGNGNIRLEVRPRVSDLDPSNGVSLNNVNIPALTVREVDTAVEMKAGQTFALAGLIQRRTEAINRGLPILADMPVLGMPFRRVTEDVNEIELLIMVTPEFVDAMDPHEVPRCYPGSGTMSPNNHELYCEGKIEVPNRCNGCGVCGCVPTHGHEPCCPEAMLGIDHTPTGYAGAAYDHSAVMPGTMGANAPMMGRSMVAPGMGVSSMPAGRDVAPTPASPESSAVEEVPAMGGGAASDDGDARLDRVPMPRAEAMTKTPMAKSLPDLSRPPAVESSLPIPSTTPMPAPAAGELLMPPAPEGYRPPTGAQLSPRPTPAPAGPAFGDYRGPTQNHYSVAREPTYRRQPSAPYRSATQATRNQRAARNHIDPATGLIGPVGYDEE